MHPIQNEEKLFSPLNNLNLLARVLVYLLLTLVRVVAIVPSQACTVFPLKALPCDKGGVLRRNLSHTQMQDVVELLVAVLNMMGLELLELKFV
jgi:hypothetical protein